VSSAIEAKLRWHRGAGTEKATGCAANPESRALEQVSVPPELPDVPPLAEPPDDAPLEEPPEDEPPPKPGDGEAVPHAVARARPRTSGKPTRSDRIASSYGEPFAGQLGCKET
jgi:hypothetical protein